MSKRLYPLFGLFAAFGVLLMPSYAFADAASYTDFASVITAITGQISVSTVVGVLAQAATVSVGLVFMWWGVRKVTKMLFASFRKGRMSV